MDIVPNRQEASASRPATHEQAEAGFELVRRVEGLYADLLKAAHEQGSSQEEFKAELIRGWNTGLVPRAVRGNDYRGSGHDVVILHGEVPDDFFAHFHEDEDFGVIMPGDDYPEGRVVLAFPMGIATGRNPNDESAFYVETLRLPQPGGLSKFAADEVAERIHKIEATLEQAEG